MTQEEKRLYMAEWRKNNKDKIKKYRVKDYKKHQAGYLERASEQRKSRNEEEWKKYHRDWRNNNSEKVREYSKRTYEKIAEKIAGYKKLYFKNHPQIRKAHWKLGNAINSGKIDKPMECSFCGIGCRIEAHHPDYSKPLDVVWLCSKCHHILHQELRTL